MVGEGLTLHLSLVSRLWFWCITWPNSDNPTEPRLSQEARDEETHGSSGVHAGGVFRGADGRGSITEPSGRDLESQHREINVPRYAAEERDQQVGGVARRPAQEH